MQGSPLLLNICARACLQMLNYIYTCAHTYLYIYIYICIHTHVYTCIHIMFDTMLSYRLNTYNMLHDILHMNTPRKPCAPHALSTRVGATPEINTSETIVDFQWHFPMTVHLSVVFSPPMDCHFPSGCLLELPNGLSVAFPNGFSLSRFLVCNVLP